MFQFGDKVMVLDKTLKSYRKMGLYCGQNEKGLAKVYLKEPIENKKTKVHCITIGEDKLSLFCENKSEQIKQRLDCLYQKVREIDQEKAELEDEIFELEKEFMMG